MKLNSLRTGVPALPLWSNKAMPSLQPLHSFSKTPLLFNPLLLNVVEWSDTL